MKDFVHQAAEYLGAAIDLLVVVLFGLWIVVIVVMSARAYIAGVDPDKITYDVRIKLGTLILLGLELLIVADVLHSIASRTMEDLAIVAVVVVIRIVLAFFLDREIRHLKDSEGPRNEGS